MTRRPSFLALAVLAVGVLVIANPVRAATRGYVVSLEGLVLTLDADTDTVIGIHQVPHLAPAAIQGPRPAKPMGGASAGIRDADQDTGIVGGPVGRSLLTPRADRMVVLDRMPYGLPCGYLVDEGPTGRIFVYDVATGAGLGRIELFVRGADRLAAVHPAGDKVYVTSDGPRPDHMTITVVSLTTFAVLKELFVPRGDLIVAQAGR